MKSKILSCLPTIFCLLLGGALPAFAQGTAFTYQGRLNNGGSLANGSFDLKFSIYDTNQPINNLLAGPVTNAATLVSNGLFVATLDFGAGLFTGPARWLEIGVRTNGSASSFSVLNPRQQITPTPMAIFASTAANATAAGSVSANAVTASGIQDGVITAAKLAAGQVVKSLNGLTDIVSISAGANVTLTTNGNSLQLAASGGATSGWALGGNGGTQSTNFLGTSDNQPLDLRVNSQRALRLEPNTSGAPNIVGGASVNFVAAGVKGAVIGGGGATNYSGVPYTNSVAADFSTVSGGFANSIQVNAGTSTVGGGFLNTIQAGASTSTIGGGYVNTIQTNAYNSTIGGGSGNVIQQTATSATVAGGANNVIDGGSTSTTIGGGLNNLIQANATYATVGGGYLNAIQNGASSSTIGGGYVNTIQTNAPNSTIGGGSGNIVQLNSPSGTIAGGANNIVQANALASTIGGGLANSVSSSYSTIGGGQQNVASGSQATVGGGFFNRATDLGSTVSGGLNNAAGGDAAVVGGGQNNSAAGVAATIPGGSGNYAAGVGSFASGVNAHVIYADSFIWGDGTQEADSTGPDRFEVLATGGVNFYTGGAGTHALSNGPGDGLDASSTSGRGVSGTSTSNDGVYGLGRNGVRGDSSSASDSGVWANNTGGGSGVSGTSDAVNGIGVYGRGAQWAGYFAGRVSVCSLEIRGGCDVAEPFPMSHQEIPKGSVVVIDDENAGQLKLSDRAYDSRVAGIVSGANGVKPGLSMTQEGVLEGGQNVALSGRVYVLADVSNGAIKPGDLLTTSGIAGDAMKVTNHTKAQGAIIGKAMSSLKKGEGMVLVLVTLQ